MKGITKPNNFGKILNFFEITGDEEGLIKMNNKIGERLLEYNIFTYITLDNYIYIEMSEVENDAIAELSKKVMTVS